MRPLVLLVADLAVRQPLGHLLHDGAGSLVYGEQLVLHAMEDSNLGLTILQGGSSNEASHCAAAIASPPEHGTRTWSKPSCAQTQAAGSVEATAAGAGSRQLIRTQ